MAVKSWLLDRVASIACTSGTADCRHLLRLHDLHGARVKAAIHYQIESKNAAIDLKAAESPTRPFCFYAACARSGGNAA
jgi:hypothetical protein